MNNYTILCVEDEPDIHFQLTFLLCNLGYNTLSAFNGIEALNILQNSAPDLILCDILMPDLSGLDLLKEIKSNLPHLSASPFIFLSALSSRSHLLHGLQLGADDYLTKPIDVELLEIKIKSNLDLVKRVNNTPTLQKIEHEVKLTKREIEVIIEFSLGKTNAKIAKELGLSEHTINDHAKSIFKKLEVNTRTQAFSKAMSLGIIGR